MIKSLSLPVVEKIQGAVLYEGPSAFNGEDIVVIATGLRNKTENEKTGDMVQIWILVSGKAPIAAQHAGEDDAVCGSCKHRHFRSCYVNLIRGPEHVYMAYKEGKYPRMPINDIRTSELFRDKDVRLGAYGDPAVVPIDVWKTVTYVCRSWTGYTHQWKRAPKALRDYCMASCDTPEEAEDAMRRGWRPFLVRQEGEAIPPGFFTCPASKEAGYRLNCQRCGVCKGGEYVPGKGLPTIVAHGPSWKKAYFKYGMKLMRNHEKYAGVFATLTLRGGKPVN